MKKLFIALSLLTTSTFAQKQPRLLEGLSGIIHLEAQPYKKMQFGASMGGLTGTKGYIGVLQSWTKAGLGYYRVMGVFDKGRDTNVIKIADDIGYLINIVHPDTREKSKVLIGIGNVPYSWLGDHDTATIFKNNKKLRELATFTNRFYPVGREQEYRELLIKLMNELQLRGYLPYVSVEFNNEVDASIYFWGFNSEADRLPAAIKLNQLKYEVLKAYPVNLLNGSYTSSMGRDTAFNHTADYYAYQDTCIIYNDPAVGMSHSWYWHDHKIELNTATCHWPVRRFNYLTFEYNVATGARPGTKYDSLQNSQAYVKYLVDFLNYFYPKINTTGSVCYIHPLVQYSGEGDQKGIMGLWKKNWSAQYKQMYYTPKPCYNYFMAVWNVVKDGYRPTSTGLEGTTKAIVINPNNTYSIISK